MASGTNGKALSGKDIVVIVREILDVQNESRTLGYILKVPRATVESIHQQYTRPKDCLFYVIDAFLKQVEPVPTWEVIANALRDPLIGLPNLAKEIESKYCSLEEDDTDVTLQDKERELAEAHQQLREKEEELQRAEESIKRLAQSLGSEDSFHFNEEMSLGATAQEQLLTTDEMISTDLEEELRKAQEHIKKQQLEIEEGNKLLQAKDMELAETQQKLRETEAELMKAEETIRKKQETVQDNKAELTETQREMEAELMKAEETVRREQETVEENEERKESSPGGKVGETKYVHVKITDGSVEEEEREETEIKQQLESELLAKETEQQQQQQQQEESAEQGQGFLNFMKKVTTKITQLRQMGEQSDSEVIVAELQKAVQEKDSELETLRAKERESGEALMETQQKLEQMEKKLGHSESLVHDLENMVQGLQRAIRDLQQDSQRSISQPGQLASAVLASTTPRVKLRKFSSYMCQVSGPGLTSATVNHPTHVLVELTDFSGNPHSQRLTITAQLELISKTTSSTRRSLPIRTVSPSTFEVMYTADSRGQHELHIQVNGREVIGSPFIVTMYLDPTKIGSPVRIVADLKEPYNIAYNSHDEMIVSECSAHRLSVLDSRGQRVRTIGSRGEDPEQMNSPAGVAVDDANDIYVSSHHKVQKFTSTGELIKCVGKKGKENGEFDQPRGITLHDKKVYVCDHNNHRIQVFDRDLNFIRSIGSRGKGEGQFDEPQDLKFDTDGNMYVTDCVNKRVQVMDKYGEFVHSFGQEGEAKLNRPAGLYIADRYIYVSDYRGDCVFVYTMSGEYVSMFGRRSWLGVFQQREGELNHPYGLTSCPDGYIHVCDRWNNKLQIY